MNSFTLGFIGAGNLATSIIGGLIATGFEPQRIIASNIDKDQLVLLKQNYAINTADDNQAVVAQADVIVISVKPQVMKEVTLGLQQAIVKKRPLIISVAAGIRLTSLSDTFGSEIAMVRAMPNTAALVGASATALFANSNASARDKEIAESIFRAIGTVVWVEAEQQLDVVTALSGSGPAYFFKFMEAMVLAGQRLGLSEQQAKILTLETAFGAAKMALSSDQSLQQLRTQVTSPGGTTAAALAILDKHHFDALVDEALTAACQRAAELAEMFG